MDKMLKNSLFMAIVLVATFVFSINVDAASLISFKEETSSAIINELSMGDITYDTSVSKKFKIVNNTNDDMSIYDFKVLDVDKYEIVGTVPTMIPANGEITVEIKNIVGVSVSADAFETQLYFVADNGVDAPEVVSTKVSGMVVPKEIKKPTVKGTYTYTVDVHGYGLRLYFEYNDYDNSLMSMSGSTAGTDAGDYFTTITLVDSNNYAWEDGTTEPLELKVTIEKLVGTPTLPNHIVYQGIDYKLSTISLSNGWSWTNPDELIKEGKHYYSVTYTGGNYVGTFVSMTQHEIKGVVAHTVNVPENPNITTSKSGDFEVLNDDTSSFTIYAKKGYILKSITVNGVEQLLNDEQLYEVRLKNVTEEIFVEAVTEKLVASLIEPNETPTFIIGSDNTLKYVFDYSMNWLFVNNSIINGEMRNYSETMEIFNFTTGETFGVEFKNEYLKTLAAGTYDFEIILATGVEVKASFTVDHVKEEVIVPEVNEPETTNPETGDNIGFYIVLLVASFGAIIFINRKKSSIR